MGASRAEKLGIFFWKLFLLKVHFQDGGQLYAHCLFYILIIWRKFLPFYFLNRGIGIYIPILTGIQNGYLTTWKIGDIFRKNIVLQV